MILPHCASVAAQAYHVPLSAVETVAFHTAGHGIGIMDIAPESLPLLVRAGFRENAVRHDACVNIAAGTWLMAKTQIDISRDPEARHPSPPPPIRRRTSENACISAAAARYRLPVILLRAVLQTENGKAGSISINTNGTYDMGPAQINSIHLPELARYGIDRTRLINDNCLNIQVGAWLLARYLGNTSPQNPRDFWQRVGNYNSATPVFNHAYQQRVWHHVVFSKPAASNRAGEISCNRGKNFDTGLQAAPCRLQK